MPPLFSWKHLEQTPARLGKWLGTADGTLDSGASIINHSVNHQLWHRRPDVFKDPKFVIPLMGSPRQPC